MYRYHSKKVVAVGILTLIAMSLYILYRLGTTWYSLIETGSILHQAVIVIFIIAELFIVVNGIFYFFNIITARALYHRLESKHLPKKWPKVIVFLPMRNEPLKVIAKTFRAVHNLDYRPLQIVVVDSSDDPRHQKEVRSLAQSFGLTYFMTPYPRHGAKAGALNEAMKVFVAPYYVLFDADYRASSDFVKLLVPLMEENKNMAFIQTPQFYGNHTISPVSRIAQIQQSIFYEYICEGKSVHNAVFLCGTNLIIRREALKSVGYWDENSITEDYSTSTKLVLAGWETKYYNFTTAFGDGPINLQQYLKQQYRWSRGTFDAYFTHFFALNNPRRHLKFWQRLEYFLSGTYFFVGVIWTILLFMPLLYIFFRIPGYQTDPLLFTVIYFPYFLLSFLFYAVTMKARRYNVLDLIRAQSLTFLTIPVYIRAFIDTVLRRKAVFETIKKDATPFEIPLSKMKLQILIMAANLAGAFYGLWILPETRNEYALMTNIFWACFHGVIMLYLPLYLYVKALRLRT